MLRCLLDRDKIRARRRCRRRLSLWVHHRVVHDNEVQTSGLRLRLDRYLIRFPGLLWLYGLRFQILRYTIAIARVEIIPSDHTANSHNQAANHNASDGPRAQPCWWRLTSWRYGRAGTWDPN